MGIARIGRNSPWGNGQGGPFVGLQKWHLSDYDDDNGDNFDDVMEPDKYHDLLVKIYLS